ncbi:MAG: NAD(P)-dependent oxidoreductase [Coriobacteriia bacterium]|nr:NAD(P)-dependent oxidoreductase [Coriobacteriia bacterium]
MLISVVEPLGISDEELRGLVEPAVEPFGAQVVTYVDRREDVASLVERCKDADAVVVSNIPFPAEVMAQCPKLKYVCVAFTGYDHVDMAYCREHGIQVSNCAGYSTVAVADLVFGLVIGLLRNIPACDAAVRASGTKAGLVGPELEGLTFGVVGCGAIGSRVARIAAAFGCTVLAYSRTRKELPDVEFVELDELLSRSDVVSLHVPQTPQTTHLINAERLALMKPSAVLVNCARGPVVDSQALADALNDGRLAGAGIDVFEMEPPVPADHPLLTAKNVLATPHVAFASNQAMSKRAAIVAANLGAYLAGEPQNLV